MQEAGRKIRIERTRCNDHDRWELLVNGRLALALEAEELHALTGAAMLADGIRQGLTPAFPSVDPEGLKVFDCPVCGGANAVLEDDTGFHCRACAARFGEAAFDDWRDDTEEAGALTTAQPYLDALYKQHGNDWPAIAFERLLQLTARYGYMGTWSQDAQERAEQEERLALHRWARDMIEKGIAFQQSSYL